ncbi:MAG: Hpt domain-containing protein [Sedimentisphaerales bacterium]|nr:Hpt domain-containing protein [Sedimentisphaerales bacterium]
MHNRQNITGGQGASIPVFDPSQALRCLDGDVDVMKQIVEIFINTSHSDMQEMQKAMASKDTEAIVARAHSIKGAAANVGAEVVRGSAYEMEKSVKAGEGEIEELFNNLEQNLHKLEEILNDYDWADVVC